MPDIKASALGWGTGGSTEGSLPTSGITVGDGRVAVATGEDYFANHLVQNKKVSNDPSHDKKTWKGPYYSKDKADPWGHKYLCNIGKAYEWDIEKDIPTHAVFVLSAGPDGIIQTSFNQALEDEFVTGGDDITSRIQ